MAHVKLLPADTALTVESLISPAETGDGTARAVVVPLPKRP